jgi:hypothetical protein
MLTDRTLRLYVTPLMRFGTVTDVVVPPADHVEPPSVEYS